MKRTFHGQPEFDSVTMANCLMLLSQGSQTVSFPSIGAMKTGSLINSSPNRVFECKTCNRQFPSFQALGGHRASHKKPRLTTGCNSPENLSPAKPKTHECSICGLEFAIGQALGGHMRRHRAAINDQNLQSDESSEMVKKSNSRRVLCLDLNLTPYENDLELFKIGKPSTPTVDCFF